MDSSTYSGAQVVAFRPRSVISPGMNMSERIDALRWADAASPYGVRRVQFHEMEPGDDPATSPFLLVYRGDEIWAAWGVARQRNEYEVWRPGTGRTIGCFPNIRSALAAIVDVPGRAAAEA
jgi:hypothetical protein